MKVLSVLAILVLGLAGIVGIAAVTAARIDAERPPPAPSHDWIDEFSDRVAADVLRDIAGSIVVQGVDDAMGGGHSWKVRCASMDGGTDVDMAINVDGGVQRFNFTDITIGNDSTTCVRVGLDDSVNQTHGARVGSGCRSGGEYPMHAKVARCQSEGAAVVVDVTAGRP